MDLASKIINCKNQIEKNNLQMVKLSKENLRLHRSLVSMMNTLDPVKMKRYEEELKGDGYKLTEYWIKKQKANV